MWMLEHGAILIVRKKRAIVLISMDSMKTETETKIFHFSNISFTKFFRRLSFRVPVIKF